MERVLRRLPPPAYLTMPALGVDISDRSLKWLELREENIKGPFGSARGNVVGGFGEIEIQKGTIESGQIKDKDGLLLILQRVREESSATRAVVSLPEEHTYTVSMRLPSVRLRELRDSILFSLDQYVPLSPAELVFDYEVVRAPNEVSDSFEVVVSAVPLTLANDYASLVEEAGFSALALEIESQAIARASVPIDERIVVMVLDLGRMRSGISICQNGRVRFSSTIEVGGIEVERALMDALGADEGTARTLKEEKGFLVREDDDATKKRVALLSKTYGAFCEEVSKQIEYWNVSGRLRLKGENDEGGEVSAIIVGGGEANTAGIVGFLEEKLSLPIEIANPWRNVLSFENTIPPMERSTALRYTTAIGLSLRNSLPRRCA